MTRRRGVACGAAQTGPLRGGRGRGMITAGAATGGAAVWHGKVKPSWRVRLRRWWARLRRRRGGHDFGDMGTAFGLDATYETPFSATPNATPSAPGDAAPLPPDADRANRRAVW